MDIAFVEFCEQYTVHGQAGQPERTSQDLFRQLATARQVEYSESWMMNIYLALAESVLVVHLLFILWVIGGVLLVRRHHWLKWFHISSLAYGIFIEVAPWPPCPLTILEQVLEERAGLTPFHSPFLLHYLEVSVYPNVSLTLLVPVAVAVCVANLVYYALGPLMARWRGRRAQGRESVQDGAEPR